MALPAEQLSREIADVRNVDVFAFEGSDIECRVHGIPECIEDLDAVSRPVL